MSATYRGSTDGSIFAEQASPVQTTKGDDAATRKSREEQSRSAGRLSSQRDETRKVKRGARMWKGPAVVLALRIQSLRVLHGLSAGGRPS